MIIDAHVHLSVHKGKAESIPESKEVLLSEMRLRAVDYAIVIPDNTEDQPHIAGLKTARTLIRDSDPLLLLGSPNVLSGGDAEIQRHDRLLRDGTIHGLKFFPGHEPYYPTDDRCLPFYAACQLRGLPVVFHTGENGGGEGWTKFSDPKHIVAVAEDFPSLKVVITHYFWPQLEYCYQVTKDTPNIYFEIAGLADEDVVRRSGGISVIQDVLARTISDRPDQVIFGTDWPCCRIQEHIDLVDSLPLDRVTREKVLSQNAVTTYNLAF